MPTTTIKGVILAGGLGTRLLPLTKVVNKSILPVYNRPLIYEPIRTLKEAGISEILVISGPGHAGQLLDLLGSGRQLGVDLSYDIQEIPKGIAHGLAVAESFAEGGPVALILGDNVFEDSLAEAVDRFRSQTRGAHVVLKDVKDPERFGVVKFSAEGVEGKERIAEIVEKPSVPPSQWAVTGFYCYDARVFDVIRGLKPSGRGEYEITDVNNVYIKEGTMTHTKVRGRWIDAGTFDSLLEASMVVAERERSAGR